MQIPNLPAPQTAEVQSPALSRLRLHGLPALLATLVAGVVLVALLPVQRWYQSHLEYEQRNEVANQLSGIAGVLSADLNERLSLVQGLAAYVRAYPSAEIAPADYATFASGLYTPGKGIRVLQLAPGGIIKLNYPAVGNEISLGRNLLTDPDPGLQNELRETQRTHKMVAGHPTKLWQGGTGIIVRQAVYRGDDELWGFVNVVLDLPSLIDNAQRGRASQMNIAMRDDLGRTFVGDASLFDSAAETTEAQLPGRTWQLAAVPKLGWQARHNKPLMVFRLLGLGVVLLAGVTTYLSAGRQAWLKRAVVDRTRALQEARQRFDNAVAGANDGLWDWDVVPNIVYWSPRFKELLGYAEDEISPSFDAWKERLHPDDHDAVIECVRLSLEETSRFATEYRLKHRDGSYRWYFAKATVVRDPETGVAVRMSGSLTDISERKFAEQELRSSEGKFRRLAESANAMICVIANRQIIYANPYASVLTGFAREEMLGRRFVDFVHPEWQASIETSLAAYTAGTGQWPAFFETVLLRKDGMLRWVEVSSAASEFEGSLLVTGIAIDVTERKQIAGELDDRLRFEAMVADLSASLFDVTGLDAERTVENALKGVGEFLEVDRIALSEQTEDNKPHGILFGHSFYGQPIDRSRGLHELHPWAWAKVDAGEIVAFSSLDELPPEAEVDRQTWERRRTRSVLIVPLSIAGEYRFGLSVATVDREKKWPDHLVKRLRVLGEILANALLRGRLEHELKDSADMLRLLNTELSVTEDRARRRLAALLHDDLAQNLFGASAELIAIRNTCPDAMQIALDRVLSRLDESLRQARDLTYDLCPPVLYELGLVPALAKLAEQFNRRYDVRFTICTADTKVSIDSDLAAMLYQAVRELFVNVAKHAKARHAEVVVEQTDTGLTITVTDDGVGCPDAENRVAKSGSGFGLFNIRERLRSLDGELTVSTGHAGGCVVRLSVPVGVVSSQGS